MSTVLIDAFELVAHSEQLLRRVDAAIAEVAKCDAMDQEKAWLATGRDRLAAARELVGDVLERSLRLDELAPLRPDYAKSLQGLVVDTLERLQGAIAYAGGPRTPLLEAIFWKVKVQALRKCERDEFEKVCSDIEKRLKSSYVRRMLADSMYQILTPVIEQLLEAIARWRGAFAFEPLEESESSLLRETLLRVARHVEGPARQARLLAQAALVSFPLNEVLESTGVGQKPKRRTGRGAGAEADDDTHPILEQEPPDPMAPTAEERAELTETHV